ncbi:MAG: M16 family metallopeptidase [Terriglobales bacterium]
MRFFVTPLLALALAGGLAGQAGSGAVAVPQIPFTTFTLPNHLRVVLSVDHALPVVTETMLFHVGSREEHPGHSGFAHLFEHLMFEGSAHAPKGDFSHLVEGYGGSFNASTHVDYTLYYESVPSNALETMMWLDADRLASLNVTVTNMKNQIAVVEEERRIDVDNAAYGQFYLQIAETAFQNWQNSHPVIGSFKDLNAATLADVQEFFREYYAPDNCILTIVGDFDPAKVRQQVEHYFAWIPNRSRITPAQTAEPPQTARRTATLHDPQAKLPALALAWQGPQRGTPDFYALVMLSRLLFNGQSSRLYQALVKNSKVAVEVAGDLGFPNADYTDYVAPGLLAGTVVYKPNFTPDEVENLVEQQIHQVEASGVSPDELQRVKTKFSSDWIRGEQTTLGRASLLALATLFDGKPEQANAALAQYLAVTSADLQRVARTYLTRARSNVIVDLPAPAAPAAKGGR